MTTENGKVNGSDAPRTKEERKQHRVRMAVEIANAIASRSGGQLSTNLFLMGQIGHDADTIGLWNVLIAAGICTEEEMLDALDEAYAKILSQVKDNAPRIIAAG
jgi:hypothetical protein